MKLNDEQIDQLRNHLQTHFKSVCSVCGGANWQFDDTLFEIRQFLGGSVSTDGLIKPIAAISCATCGHVILINAIAAGVIKVGEQTTAVSTT